MKHYPDFKTFVEAEVASLNSTFLLDEERKPLGKYGVFATFTHHYSYADGQYSAKTAEVMSDSRVQPLVRAAQSSHLQLIEDFRGSISKGGSVALRIPDQYKAEHLRCENGSFDIEVFIYLKP